MKRNKEGVLAPFYKSKILLEKVSYIKKIAKISLLEVTNIDSTNIKPQLWSTLTNIIKDNYSSYNGFVITHGTDTMAYIASALSFALGDLNKPVILTGAQKPLDDIPSDVQSNLINSVKIATDDISEVCVVFGSKILRGNRATKISESNLDAFDSPMVAPIGEISLEPKVNSFYKKVSSKNLFPNYVDFDENVVVIVLTPGLNPTYLEKIIDNYKGIILEAFGPGNLPRSLLPFLKKAKKLDIPVVIISQCRKGSTQMQLYQVGHQVIEYGAIPGYDMTVEAATVKLMWLLAQTNDVSKIRQAFKKSFAGEVTVS